MLKFNTNIQKHLLNHLAYTRGTCMLILCHLTKIYSSPTNSFICSLMLQIYSRTNETMSHTSCARGRKSKNNAILTPQGCKEFESATCNTACKTKLDLRVDQLTL